MESVKINGEEYRISPLDLEDYGTIEAHLLSQMPNPVRIVGEAYQHLPPAVAKELLDRAYEDAKNGNAISAAAFQAWCDSPAGKLYCIWLSLKKARPVLTQTECNKLLTSLIASELDKIAEKVAQASGTDQRGN